MLRVWLLLAPILVFSAVTAPSSCAAPPAPTPPPERATPEPAPTEAPTEAPPLPGPGEPVEPPDLEPRPSPGETGVPTPDPSAPCCFSNQAWSGLCKVTPSHDETCASILAYLNNPRSTGKTYCDSTDLRGGWKPVACDGG